MTAWFASPGDARERLASCGYLPDDDIATSTFLAGALGKPLLVEGPAGVGKTQLAKAIAAATGARLVRLQCYEGLDEARALYEWNYKKQLLRIQAGAGESWDTAHDDIFTEGFLLERPLLRAIRAGGPTVLLIDETDKADIEVEGLLLEVLSDFQVTIPELGTIVARRRVADNIRRFEEAVAADVRRRIAEDSGVERVSRSAVEPLPDRKDFLRMTRADLARLRREVQPLARRLGTRLAMRHRHGRRGRLDFHRTVRTSLSTGGVPLVTHARRPRPHRPELVILCDTSDSVAAFSHFTLLLTYALREQFTRVRAFGFVDRVDEITRFFAPGADPVSALTRLAEEADMTRFGRTNYGAALEGFAQRYGDAVGPRSSLLILGDARNNYQRLALPTLTEVAGRARHAHWLNPEPRAHWDTGDSEATAYASVVPMHECRNVPQLAAFIEDLA